MSTNPAICLILSSFLYSISIVHSTQSTGNLACNQNAWSMVASPADWSFPSSCIYANTNSVDGAMVWIGDNMPDSINWDTYTFEARMSPLDLSAGGANGGIAFNIQSVGSSSSSGKYYALSLFPVFNSDSIEIHLGKWDDGNNNYALDTYFLYDEPWSDGQYFDMRVEVSKSSTSVTIKSYLEGHHLGSFTDTDNPYLYGSIGMRNYRLPAQFESICVNGCTNSDDEASVGGRVFIGIVFGCLFLYCLIGYVRNGNKSKKWGDIKGNIPQFAFWKVLPSLVFVGCQISFEALRGVLSKNVGGGDSNALIETTAANENNCMNDENDHDL